MSFTTPPPRLRTFVSSDIPAALALWRDTPGIGLTASDEPDALRIFLQRNPGFSRILTNDEGELTATVLCGHDGRRGFLYHLAVAPAYRGRGYGRHLTGVCLAHLHRVGIPRATIHLYANNDEGKAFWNSTRWSERDDLVVMQFETAGDVPISTAVS